MVWMRASRRLSLVASLLVLILFVGYFLANTSKFRPLLHINVLLLLVIAAGNVLAIFSNGLFTRIIMRPFDKFIGLVESFYVSLISSVGNFFAPVGAGFGFRAVYLKKKHNFPYNQYISTLAGNYIVVFIVNSLGGLLALWLLRGRADSQYGVLVAAFVAVFLFGLFLSLVKIPKIKWGSQNTGILGQVVRNLHVVTEGWNRISANRLLLAKLTLLTTFNLLLTVGIYRAIMASLHFSISFGPLLLFSVLGSLSLFINITPANLGVKEAIYLFSSSVLGFSTSQILSFALIDRGVQFTVLAIAWIVFGRKTLAINKVQLADKPQ